MLDYLDILSYASALLNFSILFSVLYIYLTFYFHGIKSDVDCY